jgi:DNA-binding transcriptional LysR family regulator
MDVDLRHLRAFEVLLKERNLTRAAATLGVAQPALSKTLARMRRHFDDPLFVRSGNRMEPTAKALDLAGAVREVLDGVTLLRAHHLPFDPATSSRMFSFSVVDSGVPHFLPPLLDHLERHAPRVRLRVTPLDVEGLETALEAGRLDFAMGSFGSLSKRVRRQTLWPVTYVGVVRHGHPRIGATPSLQQLARERHVLVSTAGTGHVHRLVERALEKAIPAENIVCRVPSFLAAAVTVSRTDTVATLPQAMVSGLLEGLGLRYFTPPLRLPRIEISQHWHERFHREPGSQWIRSVFAELFGGRKARAIQRTRASNR